MSSKGSGSRRTLTFLAKAGLSAAVLFFVIRKADLGAVWGEITAADPLLLGLALLTPFLGYGITSLRWQGLLRAAGSVVPLGSLYRACMTAVFFNQILPSTVGGDVARMYAAWKAGAPKPVAVASLMVDRVVGILAQVLLAAIAIPFLASSDQPRAIYIIVAALALALIVLVGAVFQPSAGPARLVINILHRLPGPFGKIATKLEQGFAPYRGRWGVLARALAFSFVLMSNVILMHWLIGSALGLHLALTAYVFAIPVAYVVMLVPISINGIGIREGIFALLLGAYGVSEPEAVAMALLAFATFMCHGALGGVLFAFGRTKLDAVRQSVPMPAGAQP